MDTTRNSTTLTDLPLELLLMISEHLSSADVVCLALCNRHLLSSLAGTSFCNFSNGRTGTPSDDTRINLLSQLSRDLPQYYICFTCLRLHSWQKTGLPKSEPLDKSLKSLGGKYYCFEILDRDHHYLQRPLPLFHYPAHSFYEFHFIHLQLVMRRFYYGPGFGIPVESLLYTEVGHSRIISASTSSKFQSQKDLTTVLFSVEGRICSTPPSLCLRTQELALVARQNVPQVWLDSENGPKNICKHIYSIQLGFADITNSYIERYCSEASSNTPAEHGRCQKCNTLWKLEIRTVNEEYECLIFTRWMDLGPGLSPHDARWKHRVDPRWRIRLYDEASRELADDEMVDSRSRFETDSIQASFPNALSEDAMYHRNLSLLQGQAYKKVMTPKPAVGVYILHGEAKSETNSSRCVIL